MLTKEQIIEVIDRADTLHPNQPVTIEAGLVNLLAQDLLDARNALQDVLDGLDHYVDITSDDDEDWECEPEDRWRMVRDIREPLLKYHPDNTERSLPKESTRSTQKETP